MEQVYRKKVKKGEIIYHEGEMSPNMFKVVTGTCGIYTKYGTPDQQELGIIDAGGYLNVISFLDSRPRASTAVALEDSSLVEISMENFEELFRAYPAKVLDLMQYMSRRMLELERAYLDAAAAAQKAYKDAELPEQEQESMEHHRKSFRFLSALMGNRG